ncbi:MAG: S-layer homology domain-containing protein [Oscillospiraceae bacterium]|nr:S-layer homology domain-containing protein [Oscillospiraceae bacterium]
MRIRKILAVALTMAVMPAIPTAFAADAELFSGTYTAESFTVDAENGVTFEQDVPDGDYTVTVKTGGDTETNANIYINGGERVRVYTLEAGETQDNEQPVVPKDGKISVQVLGTNPNVTEIDIEQLPDRTEPGEKITIYIAGDSTAQTYDYKNVFPQTGWGQVFGDYFTDDVVVENRSMGGRSSKSYNNDGRLDRILTEMHPGDYVFIQFGINDGAENKPERYISVEDYKELITNKYIGEVEKRGGIPVLMTATAAAWWDEENNCFMESRADYADPTRELAAELGVKFIDINRIMTDEWNIMLKGDVLSGYFICEPLESKAYPDGTDDHTHLKAKGAKRIAKMIAKAIPENVPELAEYLKGDEEFTDISGHWAEDMIKQLASVDMIQGDGKGHFNPENTVTRAEFLKMVMDATGVVPHAYRDGECSDASADDWYCYYLQGALDKGIVSGKEPFDGNRAITREEMAALAVNCMDLIILSEMKEEYKSKAELNGTSTFTDAQMIDPEYDEAVAMAAAYYIIDGYKDGTFRPTGTLTRAEAVKVAQYMNGVSWMFTVEF